MKSKKENKDSKILLIDCSNLIYAAYHTTGTLSFNGKPTGIIYGFLRKLLFLANKFNTNRFVTCWDSGITYRHKDYKGYKHKRVKRREEESPQEQEDRNLIVEQSLELRLAILPALGFKNNYAQKFYEADDLLAFWSNKLFWSGNRDLIMVTSDNDMYQCLDTVKIYSPITKKMTTRKTFISKYGIEPSSWTYAKAIGGCQGDSVEGIQGVSDPKNPKSLALKYIRGEMSKGKVYDRITSHAGKKLIAKNRPIVTCPYRTEDLKKMIRRRDKFSRSEFLRIFDHLHFKSFLKREEFSKWKQAFLR